MVPRGALAPIFEQAVARLEPEVRLAKVDRLLGRLSENEQDEAIFAHVVRRAHEHSTSM
jgi:hypothetical protein